MEMMKKHLGRIHYLFVFLLLVSGTLLFFILLSERKPNVLLIVVDTLRADFLSCYRGKEKTSPNIDRLAASGVLVERMICQVPQTLPSFCSILTGSYPVTHGVRGNGMFLLPPANYREFQSSMDYPPSDPFES